jgi:enamine deaminase RidA (YjgF/YER057c/UK114 family)
MRINLFHLMDIAMKKLVNVLRHSILILFSTQAIASAATPEPTDSPAIKMGNLVFISGQGTGSIHNPDPSGAAIAEALQKIRVLAKEMGGDLNGVTVKCCVQRKFSLGGSSFVH